MSSSVLPIVLEINGEAADAATECASIGGYVLVLSTAIADRLAPVDLHSTYVGHRDGETAVTHLALIPGAYGGRLDCERRPSADLPVGGDDRGRCLYDHLQRLLTLLHELGYSATVEVGDDAVTSVNA